MYVCVINSIIWHPFHKNKQNLIINMKGGSSVLKHKTKFKVDKLQEKANNICEQHGYPQSMPTILPAVRNIVVIGDIHGDMELAKHILTFAGVAMFNGDDVKWIGEDTYVVQVGDQVDRCRDPKGKHVNPTKQSSCNTIKNVTYMDEASDVKILKMFTELHRQAREHLPPGAVISLIGNHELANNMGDLNYVSYENIHEFDNYIDPQTKETIPDGFLARKHAFKPGNEYGIFMGCTRHSAIIIGSNFFSHAGLGIDTLNENDITGQDDINTIQQGVKMWLLGLLVNDEYIEQIIDSSNSFFWSRLLGNLPNGLHASSAKCKRAIDEVLVMLHIGHIIIGHTPQFIKNKNTGINNTCDVVFRTDTGSSKAFYYFDKGSRGRLMQYLQIKNDDDFYVHRILPNGETETEHLGRFKPMHIPNRKNRQTRNIWTKMSDSVSYSSNVQIRENWNASV